MDESVEVQFQALCTELQTENAMLSERVVELEQQVLDLESEKQISNQPLPALYVQLNSTRKTLTVMEKQVLELESENKELNYRLERTQSSIDKQEALYKDASLSKIGSSIKKSTLFSSTSKDSSHTEDQMESIKALNRTVVESNALARIAELESEKLVLAEQLVKKDEELQKTRDEQKKQLCDLEAGIDGVEMQFNVQISKHIHKTNQQLEVLFQRAAQFETTEFELQKSMTDFREDLSTVKKALPNGLEKVKESVLSSLHKPTREIEEQLELKTRSLEEAQTQITMLSEKTNALESEIARLKTEYSVSQEAHDLENTSSTNEIETLKSNLSELELEVKLQSTVKDSFHKDKQSNRDEADIKRLKDQEQLEQLMKENADLKNELVEVSSKIVGLEEENDSMRFVADNQGDLLCQCLNLEEELQALRTINQDLEDNICRKKKRMEKLQSKDINHSFPRLNNRGFGSRKRPLDHVSNQVNVLVQTERRFEDLEEVVENLKSERDALLQDKVSWNKTMHSLIKENKDLSKTLNRYKSSLPRMEEKLEKSNSKIKKLQAQIQVYALVYSHSVKGAFCGADHDEEILNKLIKSQISLAEMDERLIKLRRELHKAVARNLFLVTKLNRFQRHCK
eukprot:g7854.t1